MLILIAEDNSTMRRTIRGIAAGRRDRVIECGNGQEAVEQFSAARPDLVLMDISMPVLDGIKATRTIHSIDPSARIVIVSENDSNSFRNASHDAGAMAFIAKSDLFELETLIRNLRA